MLIHRYGIQHLVSAARAGWNTKGSNRGLDEAARKALTTPDLAKKLQTAGLDPEPTTPEEFRKLVESEIAKWRKVIQEAGIGKS